MAPMASSSSGDLPIRVLSRRFVKASDTSIEPHFAAFSNLDLYSGNIQAWLVCIYPKLPKATDFSAVVAAFEAGLPSLLNHLYPLAGRIVSNPSSGLPELHCNNQGAELVVGEVDDVALGSLDYGLVDQSLNKITLPFAEDVTLSVQLLSFACGGFSVAWGSNHIVNDGCAINMAVRMWSELSRSGKIAEAAPSYDRSVFRPRDPPSYSASLAAMYTRYDEDNLVNVLTTQESFVDRQYYVEAADIAALREEASAGGDGQRASRVQALSAYFVY